LCPLQGQQFVPYEPPAEGKKLRFIIVGEGPGRREVMMKRPFVGQTGQHLDRALVEQKLNREEAWVTNAHLCLPESEDDAMRASECCAPRLLNELAELPKNVPIVPLGKEAVRSVLGIKVIFIARGFVWTAQDKTDAVAGAEAAVRRADKVQTGSEKSEKAKVETRLRLQTIQGRAKLAGRIVLPTIHPSFAFIHNELWATIFGIDLNRIARWINGELTADMLADKIQRVHSISALKKTKRSFLVSDDAPTLVKALDLLGKVVACDIETERVKPIDPLRSKILTVQLSDGVRTVVIGSQSADSGWDARKHAKLLTDFFRGRTVVMHNGFCFDQIALERDGVDCSVAQLEDTLTAHHAFASHFPQKLDHVVSTFLDSSPWKILFGARGADEKGQVSTHANAEVLTAYGACDAALTVLAWNAMQADLADERAVYEYDKRRSVLYKSMQVHGYPVDRRRRRLLSKLLKHRAAALVGRMRRLSRRPHFEPRKLDHVRYVLFKVLKAPFLNPTKTGLASTSNATLESIRTGDYKTGGMSDGSTRMTKAARFAETVLNWRVTDKIKGTYIDSIRIHSDGRAHYNFKPFGVVTGRPASRILSAPRWSKTLPERVREVYRAEPGHTLIYFDLAQAEARFAANLSGDKNFLEACAKDVHTRNALILFGANAKAVEQLMRDPKGKNCPKHSEKGSPHAPCDCGKQYRDVTKNVGFAIIYQAGIAKVMAFLRSQGFPVDLTQVEEMFAAMRGAYPDYDRYFKENMAFVEKNGHLRMALSGRIVWFGFHPEPAKIANTPIQGGIADVMDKRLLDDIVPAMPVGVHQILHHYDSATFHVPNKYVEYKPKMKDGKLIVGKDGKPETEVAGPVVDVIDRVWKEPVRLKDSIVCRGDREFLLPADIKAGMRWSDM
jgi:uracil-DNA glycosylase family 4